MDIHSGLVLSQASDRPMYLQIVDQIKMRVAVGDWLSGQEIPSIRGLAAELRVSVITVKRAYYELEREGIIITNQGKGSFISDRVPDLRTEVKRDELVRHLQEAVEISRLLGWSEQEIRDALESVQSQNLKGDLHI
jgi:GntR family transcriptional regulator